MKLEFYCSIKSCLEEMNLNKRMVREETSQGEVPGRHKPRPRNLFYDQVAHQP